MGETNYYELFGVPAPEAGGKEPEAAEPAAQPAEASETAEAEQDEGGKEPETRRSGEAGRSWRRSRRDGRTLPPRSSARWG